MKKTLMSLIAMLAVPAVVYAHVYMLECTPEQDAVLKDTPKKVTMTFVGSVEPAFSKVEVFSPEGRKVSGKTVFNDDDTVMEVDLEENLAPGEYTVKWKCMSLDGHKQTGEFKFTID